MGNCSLKRDIQQWSTEHCLCNFLVKNVEFIFITFGDHDAEKESKYREWQKEDKMAGCQMEQKKMKFNQFQNQTTKVQDRETVISQNHLWKRHKYFTQLQA